MSDCEKNCTAKGDAPENPRSSPTPTDRELHDGQKADHWVLCPEERAKGYIRPVRDQYKHLVCGTVTRMPQACAETYARQPSYYGSTFCCGCREYLPVGAGGQFVWLDDGTRVGT